MQLTLRKAMCISCKDSPPKTVSGDTTLGTTDYTVYVDSTAAPRTITLPAAPTNGQEYRVKNIGTGGNIVTIDGNGKLIDGAATYLLADGDAVALQYVLTAWYVLP